MKIGEIFSSKLLLIAAVLAMLMTSNLSAAVVACPMTSSLDVLIASFNSLANACASQDKLFWNFTYTPGANAPAASNVSTSLVFQTGSVDIHGWNFGSTWSQNVASGALANFVLSYTIEICPSGTAGCTTPAPGLNIFTADAVYAPSSVFMPGPETVTWSMGTPGTRTLIATSPGPMANSFSGVGVGVPVTVTANFSGTGAITQTTLRFYETAVPEPTTMVLLLGGAGLIALGWRSRKPA